MAEPAAIGRGQVVDGGVSRTFRCASPIRSCLSGKLLVGSRAPCSGHRRMSGAGSSRGLPAGGTMRRFCDASGRRRPIAPQELHRCAGASDRSRRRDSASALILCIGVASALRKKVGGVSTARGTIRVERDMLGESSEMMREHRGVALKHLETVFTAGARVALRWDAAEPVPRRPRQRGFLGGVCGARRAAWADGSRRMP